MAKLSPVEYDDGTDSLSRFLDELVKLHHGQEEEYLIPLIKFIRDFEEYGPLINLRYSKKFPPYKDLKEIIKGLSELRTYRCRYFIYKVDKFEWIGLHGYEKKSDDMPDNQIAKVKGEIKKWQSQKKKK